MSHFQSLHSNEPSNEQQKAIIDELQKAKDITTRSHSLDYLITESEIRTAAGKLKNNKSSFSDKIKNEMIKSSLNELFIWFEFHISGAPNVNFRKTSVRKTIWDLEFSEHFL